MLSERHPRMYELFGAYFNQDYDLWGTTIPQILSCYKEVAPRKYHYQLIDEINSFIREHPADLDSAFENDYGEGFDPHLWGYTTITFLSELIRLLHE
ncbi:hypothetical protein LJ656_01305 [Paraburkholderia sp. MMS20-SJTR3]|uniref:CdiI immunity protein domain-containing protein n=1 Tax=Paraburkholderia sejongensis TaxID=2886946 RepID=A0ABS8JMT6_9BURK|nr:contact-dependent growth inhibition system immunity protein [Paraburkholderia sp. MMS20-SJTR3]MCC8391211.1 hypothetical protein [Paraburkholderia sp. MMS20-SJTR3]